MGRLVVYFKRNNEARRGHWFGEADDTGGLKHIGSNTFSNRRVRHKVWNLEESSGLKHRLGKIRICRPQVTSISVLARSLLILPLAGFYLSGPA